MCGRFNVESDPLSKLLLELVRMRHPGPDNHNAAPTETIVVLRVDDAGVPQLVPMRWWLTPYWSSDLSARYATFNAQSENVEQRRAFREPFQKRRCVVPVSGFYEWQRPPRSGGPSASRGAGRGSAGSTRLPYYIRAHDGPGLLLAGIWDRWRNRDTGEVLESFAILTTRAAAGLEFIHDRQPVMLSMENAHRWLGADMPAHELKAMLDPRLPVDLDAVPVSTYVNNARNKEARCIEPIGLPVVVAADRP